MSAQRILTVASLEEAGFKEVGCWSPDELRLNPPKGLPSVRGVYAFAIDECAMYVGLASRSVKQRLAFYSRPGVTQRTNVRLNSLIRELSNNGHIVRIFIAHPPDLEWNGLRVSGSEGLEAALIEDFRPPWNMKGWHAASTATVKTRTESSVDRRPRGSVPRGIVEFVRAHPACTELQIAKGVFGPEAVQPQANTHCRKLVERGLLERLRTRPATYRVT